MSDPLLPAGSWVEVVDERALTIVDPQGNTWTRSGIAWSTVLTKAIRRGDIVRIYPTPSITGGMKWVPHGSEETWWIAVDEHSVNQRYRALREMENHTGEDWRSFNARRVWVRDHSLDRCPVWQRQQDDEKDDQLELVDSPDGDCWCDEWGSPDGCVNECERNAEGATPAYRIEQR